MYSIACPLTVNICAVQLARFGINYTLEELICKSCDRQNSVYSKLTVVITLIVFNIKSFSSCQNRNILFEFFGICDRIIS